MHLKIFYVKCLCVTYFYFENIRFKLMSIAGKSNLVQPEMITLWCETSLPTLLSQYKLEDICNTGEFGLFINIYQTEPPTQNMVRLELLLLQQPI